MKMNKIKILIILLLAVSISCKDDENAKPQQLTKETLSGFVQKGPFINGTSITVSELDESLVQTGNTFNTQIVDNSGIFELNDLTLSSPFVQLQADGFYFDEVIGEKSSAQLTLFALSDITSKYQINVNILTHLEKGRVEFLIGEDVEFNQAKDSAQHELLSAFGVDNQSIENSEELDISVNKFGNATLIAISIILQANNSVADLTELLANINTDFRQDGILNSETIKSELFNTTQNLNLEEVRTNLENRYSELGLSADIADFESVIEQYLASQKPFDINAEVSNVTCNGLNDGSIDITVNEGTEPFTFEWSNGASTEDVENLASGSYTVTITDANDYVLHKNDIIVSEPEVLEVSSTVNHVTSIDGSDGSITLTVSGGTEPFTYEWSNSETTDNLQNLEKGFYSVTLKDSNSCTTQLDIAVQEPVELSIEKTDVDCYGDNQGTINLSIAGGLEPYTILWSNGSQSTELTSLSASTYSVTLTDELGYTVEGSAEVTQPDELTIIPNITHPSDNQQGIVKVEISGGTEPYNYEWSNNTFGQNSGYFNNGEVFELTLVVTDQNNCSTESTFKINNTYKDPRDGEVYPIVKIGNQIWMARNLNYDAGDGSWYFDNNNSYEEDYGRLYSYSVRESSVPEGWHIPSSNEWEQLMSSVNNSASKLKTEDWNGTNETEFSAFPGGRYYGGLNRFDSFGSSAHFHVSNFSDSRLVIDSGIYFDGGDSNSRYSIRCIRD